MMKLTHNKWCISSHRFKNIDILDLGTKFKLYGGTHMEHTFTETSIIGDI